MNNLRAVLEIDVNALKDNLDRIKKRNKNKKIIAVAKASCYGLSKETILFIEDEIDCLGVATYEEGISYRILGCKLPILIFGYVPIENISVCIKYNLMISIYSVFFAREVNAFLERNDLTCCVHLKINTGMNRFGIKYDDYSSFRELIGYTRLKKIGVYSHFTNAQNDTISTIQKNNFMKSVEFFRTNGVEFTYRHVDSSYSCLKSDIFCNTLRVGYALYGGFYPFTPVATFKGRIVHVTTLCEGESLGYGEHFIAKETTRVGIVSAGYGDGVPINLSNVGKVLFDGDFLPIIGRICMDVTFIDVSSSRAKIGDYVTFFGNGKNRIYYDEIGFGYQVICGVTDRVKRVFLR